LATREILIDKSDINLEAGRSALDYGDQFGSV
jgi:hypothetical protein